MTRTGRAPRVIPGQLRRLALDLEYCAPAEHGDKRASMLEMARRHRTNADALEASR